MADDCLQALGSLAHKRSSRGVAAVKAACRKKSPGTKTGPKERHPRASFTPDYDAVRVAERKALEERPLQKTPVTAGRVGGKDPYVLDDDEEFDLRSLNGLETPRRRPLSGTLDPVHVLKRQKTNEVATSRGSPGPSPPGMVNYGNTCYMNSVLQVLFSLPLFLTYLSSDAIDRLALPTDTLVGSLRAFAEEYKVEVGRRRKEVVGQPSRPALGPMKVRQALARTHPHPGWRSTAQQDAHEFLVALLDTMQQEVIRREIEASGGQQVALSQTCCPTAHILSGCLTKLIECVKCGERSESREQFTHLSLEVGSSRCSRADLQLLLGEYFQTETVHKHCERCDLDTPHRLMKSIRRLPRVLALHLKRFNMVVGGCRKLQTPVVVNPQLDLSQYRDGQQRSTQCGEAVKGVEDAELCATLKSPATSPGTRDTIGPIPAPSSASIPPVVAPNTFSGYHSSSPVASAALDSVQVVHLDTDEDEQMRRALEISRQEYEDHQARHVAEQDLVVQAIEESKATAAQAAAAIALPDGLEASAPPVLTYPRVELLEDITDDVEGPWFVAPSRLLALGDGAHEGDRFVGVVPQAPCRQTSPGSKPRLSNGSKPGTPADGHVSSSDSHLGREACSYVLQAVVRHQGDQATCGHYVADVRALPGQEWYTLNDSGVTSTSLQRTLQLSQQEGYMFFYTSTLLTGSRPSRAEDNMKLTSPQ